ncbi:hypothetical protein [Halomonas sp. 328]|uniref:hypothetical protein n=1 Tax=Halomonas sp. 328 TaxID=2776704 RepID=UPI0018A77B96|nr:hypothetical protein [Halomonas sp. 328]MBF8224406.1 hypothetical protein [Halomonas sp. 328]
MAYLLALLLGSLAPFVARLRVVRGGWSFAQAFLGLGVMGSIVLVAILFFLFGDRLAELMNADAGNAYFSRSVRAWMGLMALPLGFYWFFTFLAMWRSAGRFSAGRRLLARYLSLFALSSAAACVFAAPLPIGIMLLTGVVMVRRQRRAVVSAQVSS